MSRKPFFALVLFAMLLGTGILGSCASSAGTSASAAATSTPAPAAAVAATVAIATPEPTAEPTAAPTTTAAAPTVEPTPDLAMRIDDLLRPLAETGRFSGSVLVAKDGDIILSQGYGFANREYDLPNEPDTKFRLGDMTQIFTSLAIMQLKNEGKLAIEDSVCTYIDNCPDAWQPVTIHHLLTHSSGIRDATTYIPSRKFARMTKSPAVIIADARDRTLTFIPGESWGLSLLNYTLLGEIVKKTSGQEFDDYVNEHILQPLAMESTGFDHNDVLKKRASGYKETAINAEFMDLRGVDSSLGMYSTVEDLYRLDQALYDGSILPASLVDEMTSPSVYTPFNKIAPDYGNGWWTETVFDHLRVDIPAERVPGTSNEFLRFPNERVTIILLSNRENTVLPIVDPITKVVFDIP